MYKGLSCIQQFYLERWTVQHLKTVHVHMVCMLHVTVTTLDCEMSDFGTVTGCWITVTCVTEQVAYL